MSKAKEQRGKKCKKTRKACRMTCGLCVPGVDPTTKTSRSTTTIRAARQHRAGEHADDLRLHARGCWRLGYVTTGVAPAYFCVKTEYKEEVAQSTFATGRNRDQLSTLRRHA